MADPRARSETSIGRYLVYAGPLVWAVLIVFHPNPGGDSPYEGISDVVDRWLFVHVGQLILTPFLFLAVWRLLDGLSSAAATSQPVRPGCVDGVLQRVRLCSRDRDRHPHSLGQRPRRRGAGRRCAGNRIRRRGQQARRKHFRDCARGRRLLADRRDRGGRSPAQGRLREGRCRGNQPVGCRSRALCPGGDWISRALPRWSPP